VDYPLIYLLRHGQTEWNAQGRFQGQKNSDLTAKGHGDARAQGRILGPIFTAYPDIDIFASPLGRVRQTVDIALEPHHRSAIDDPDLMEISSGNWEGKTLRDIESGWPDLFKAYQAPFDLFMLAPGGEGAEALFARSTRFLQRLTGPAILFTHGTTMNVLRGLIRGLPYAEISQLDHRQGCVYRIENGVEEIFD